jgi:hypothetical protein
VHESAATDERPDPTIPPISWCRIFQVGAICPKLCEDCCLSCERVVGRYPQGGVHGSTMHHLDEPTPRAEISTYIDTGRP